MPLQKKLLRFTSLFAFVLLASIPACQCPPAPHSATDESAEGAGDAGTAAIWESVPIGRDLFGFKWEQVRRIELTRRDPSGAGGAWEIGLVKDFSATDPVWKIDTLSRDGSPDPVDRLADTAFLNHLVDTLTTLRAEAPAPDLDEGTAGLTDPAWEIRWETEEGRAFELRLGAPLENGAIYAQVANPRDASERSRIFTSRGAALEMLSRVTSVEVLRMRVLTPFTADDVDALELGGSTGASAGFFAQRQGAAWADRKNRSLKNESEVHAFVERLVHLRAKAFEESPEKAARISAAIRRAPRHEAKFTDRQGNVTRLALGLVDGNLWATIDGRDGVAFEMHPETEKIFAAAPASK